MYLLTPILIVGAIFVGGRTAFAVVAGTFIAVAFWVTSIMPQFRYVVYATDMWSTLSVAPYFLMGMLYAVCGLDRTLNIYLAAAGLFALAIFETNAAVKEAALLVVLPYFSLSFGTGFVPLLRKITRGNDLSYGLFLYGFPVQQMLHFELGGLIGPWKTFVLATFICAGLAYLSWNFIEKPALNWKPRARRPAADSELRMQEIDLPASISSRG
jgi:peptidoglycan/LPS O-acetylase OafA/YrhL